jgi:ABC-type transport system involved in multi-copper enzyme maturation permease subunit
MTAIAPYQSQAPTGRDRFGRLVRAEWTKFRTVRGWVIAILLAPLLIVAVGFLTRSGCNVAGANGRPVACPAPPTGPGGQAVVDSFYFAHRALTGNGTITVRVTSLTGEYRDATGGTLSGGVQPGVQPWSKAGIMVSASTAPGSAYAAMLVTGGNGARMQWNYTGDSPGLPGAVSASSPRWLRLTRSGDTVTGYDSPDGTHWTAVNSVVLRGLPSPVQVGLFTTSPGAGGTSPTSVFGPSEATGTFDDVGLTWAGAQRSWTGTSIGAMPVGPNGPDPFNGSFTHSGDAFRVTGSGDIAPAVPETWNGLGTKAEDALYGTVVGLIAVIIVAALFVTAEYRRGLIRLTFAASPRRGRALAAKAVVVGLATFVVSLAGAAIALYLAIQAGRDDGNPVLPASSFTDIRMVAGAAAMLAVAAMLALALATLARRGVTAVTVVIVVIFLPFVLATVEGLLPLAVQEWLMRVTPAAAFAVIQSIPAYHQVNTQYSPAFGYFPLAWWAGFAVLCAWAVVALAGATYALRRRDV